MWPFAFSVTRKPRYNFVVPAYYPFYLVQNADGLVTVHPTSPKPMPSLPPQSDYHPSEALDLRAAMTRDRDRAIRRRDMRAIHEIESDLREVTRAILGKGV